MNKFLMPVGILSIAAFSSLANAADFPEKTITIVNPYSPGGNGDIQSRHIADFLSKKFDVTVNVESRAGGGGSVGMNYVKAAKPNGYTIGFTAIGPSTVTPNRTNSGYNTVEDFETISHISSTPYTISVNGDSDVKSLDDLMEILKTEEVNYGSTGAGLHTHLVIEKFLDGNEVDPAHISSSGASGTVTALLGKHIDFAALSLPDVVPYHQSGDFRTIGVGTENRVEALSDVPTFKEQGYDFVSGAWFGFIAPKGTPEDIIETLDEAIKESLMDEKIVKAFDDIGLNIDYKSHDEFREVLESDYEEVGAIVNG